MTVSFPESHIGADQRTRYSGRPSSKALISIRTDGSHAFSLRALAQAAGVSPTPVDNHFAKKQDIAAALVNQARSVSATYLLRGLDAEAPLPPMNFNPKPHPS